MKQEEIKVGMYVTQDGRMDRIRSRADIAQAVTDFRSRRAGGEGAGKVGVKEKFTIGGKNIFRWRRYGGKPWNCEEYANGVWNPAEPTDEVEGEKYATPADLAASGILISDIANPELRAAVEALRRPTLPDGSEMVMGEMYVSDGGDWLTHIHNKLDDECFESRYWEKDQKFWSNRPPYNALGVADYGGNNLKRLAHPSDIPPEVNIDIVPERIREQVRRQRGCRCVSGPEIGSTDPHHPLCPLHKSDSQRGAGALKWNGWYIFRNTATGSQRYDTTGLVGWTVNGSWSKEIDQLPLATPAQIIDANVPEQDIPACQIEGVREERGKRASVPPKAEMSDRARKVIANAQNEARKLSHNYIGTEHILLSLIREPNTVAGNALANCGVSGNDIKRAVFNLLGIDKPASSPSPDSGACQCEAANTLRDLIEVYDRFISAKTVSDWVDETKNLGRKFELARESLGVESLNAGTEAA